MTNWWDDRVKGNPLRQNTSQWRGDRHLPQLFQTEIHHHLKDFIRIREVHESSQEFSH